MPLKLNLGLMKKIGQPQYGSLSASCHLEMEVESSLLNGDAEAFYERARQTFAACRRAVDMELACSDRRGRRGADAAAAALESDANKAAGCRGRPNGRAENARETCGEFEHDALEHASSPTSGMQGDVADHAATTSPGDESDDEATLLPASASQLSYVRRLASRIGRAAALRVEVLAQNCFGKPLAELSREEASRLIDTLRAVKAGELDWETVLEQSVA